MPPRISIPVVDPQSLRVQADGELAQRGRDAVWAYPLLVLILWGLGEYWRKAPGALVGMTVWTLGLSLWRMWLLRGGRGGEWKRRWVQCVVGSAAGWGLFLAYTVGALRYDGVTQVVLIAVAGVCAGAGNGLAPDRWLATWFPVVVLVPSCVSHLYWGGSSGNGMALVTVVFGAYMVVQGRRLHAQYWGGLRDRQRLQASEEQLLMAQAAAGIGVWDWDAGTGRAECSETLLALLPVANTEQGVSGAMALACIHEEDQARVSAAMRAAIGDGAGVELECRVKEPGGGVRWLQCRAQVQRDGAGAAVRAVGAVTDVTAARRAQDHLREYAGELSAMVHEQARSAQMLGEAMRELRAAKRRAEEEAQAKGNFMAHMSHEIRTPLNGLLGMAALLRDTEMTEEQGELVETIRGCGDALLAVVNDVLDLSKMEAGMVALEAVDFPLGRTAEECVELLAESAQSKGLAVRCFVGSGLPEWVVGDAGRLRQVLLNLIGNAIKFTEQGSVTVRLSAQGRPWMDGGTVLFEVIDTGIGISKQGQERLFEAYTQADASTTRRFGGTGLGLTITRRLVELMGGEMGLRSEPERGSTFWFTLRLRSSGKQGAEGLCWLGLRGQRVLAVHGDAEEREALAENLSAMGLRVGEAGDMTEALAALDAAVGQQEPYQGVLVDQGAGAGSGLAVAEEIHKNPCYAGLPLILMSGWGERPDAERLVEAGVAATLRKPLRRKELEQSLRELLGGDGMAEPVMQPRAAPAAAGERGWVLLAEDNKVNQRVAVRMLEKLGCRVDLAVNGLEAVEAAMRNDYDAVFMDCFMPEVDGFAAARQIRLQQGGKRHVPVIALTASALEGDREKCLAAGMDDYLTKPVRQEDLQSMLDRWAPAR